MNLGLLKFTVFNARLVPALTAKPRANAFAHIYRTVAATTATDGKGEILFSFFAYQWPSEGKPLLNMLLCLFNGLVLFEKGDNAGISPCLLCQFGEVVRVRKKTHIENNISSRWQPFFIAEGDNCAAGGCTLFPRLQSKKIDLFGEFIGGELAAIQNEVGKVAYGK